MHNWEMVIHFHVHGQAKNLFGDGFAVWYTKERMERGESCDGHVTPTIGRSSLSANLIY